MYQNNNYSSLDTGVSDLTNNFNSTITSDNHTSWCGHFVEGSIHGLPGGYYWLGGFFNQWSNNEGVQIAIGYSGSGAIKRMYIRGFVNEGVSYDWTPIFPERCNNGDISNGTILEWFLNNPDINDTFCVEGAYPSDAPIQNEGYVRFLRASANNRTIVLFIPYSATNPTIYKRSIFNGNWISEWETCGTNVGEHSHYVLNNPTSGHTLTLQSDGNLVLVDGNGNFLWSSQYPPRGSASVSFDSSKIVTANHNHAGQNYLYKQNGMVVANISFEFVTGGITKFVDTEIGTIPEEFAPSTSIVVTPKTRSGCTVIVKINEYGTISANLMGDITGDDFWFSLNLFWFV